MTEKEIKEGGGGRRGGRRGGGRIGGGGRAGREEEEEEEEKKVHSKVHVFSGHNRPAAATFSHCPVSSCHILYSEGLQSTQFLFTLPLCDVTKSSESLPE